jgi:arginase
VSVESLGPELTAEIGLVASRCVGAYLHLDLDVLDPSEGRVNSYAAPAGLSREDVVWAVREIAQSFFVFGAALTAFDPGCDSSGRALEAAVAMGLAIVDCAPDPDPDQMS